jgi:hypothetical protein
VSEALPLPTRLALDAVPRCPERFRGAIARYLGQRAEPGRFVRCVLENDLMGAVGAADEESARELKSLVDWCWQSLPSNAWGTKERVRAWLKGQS